MINGVVASLIGIYLVMVLWNGKEGQMLSLISEQSGFFKWAGALLTLSYIYSATPGKAGEFIRQITTMALIAFVLLNGEKLFGQVTQIFSGSEAEQQQGASNSISSKYFGK